MALSWKKESSDCELLPPKRRYEQQRFAFDFVGAGEKNALNSINLQIIENVAENKRKFKKSLLFVLLQREVPREKMIDELRKEIANLEKTVENGL